MNLVAGCYAAASKTRHCQSALRLHNARMGKTNRPSKGGPRRVGTVWTVYRDATRQPLYCLLLLLPLVGAYELGALLLRPAIGPEPQLVAYRLIQSLLDWFGAGGIWLPGVVLLVTLSAWHLISRHPWRIHTWVLAGMVVESLLLTVPLFVLNRVLLQAGDPAGEDWRSQLVFALGAGVYEELVFRLYLITGLTMLAVKVFHVPQRVAIVSAIAVAVMFFARCHFPPLGSTTYTLQTFAFFVAAGAYLSIVFVGRGLGVATGCHAAYNLILLFG
ncbi:MAG: CPBP family intramembrane metalloprotease [Planctomycetes bacterium]|nr:CPBP family intramembrane metalloprotease [Planctomycetota bacterium]